MTKPANNKNRVEPMIDRDTLGEIQELNMTYLLLAKQLLTEDRETGMFRLGFDESMADFILSLSAKRLSQLSRTNQLLFAFRFEDVGFLDASINSQRDYLSTPNHHSLILASKAVATTG